MPIERPRSELGSYLKELRDARKVSQGELVRRSDGQISGSHLAQVETGDRGLSREKVLVIAEALRVDPEEQELLMMLAGHDPRGTGDFVERAHITVHGTPEPKEALALLEGAADLDADRQDRLLRYFRALKAEQTQADRDRTTPT